MSVGDPQNTHQQQLRDPRSAAGLGHWLERLGTIVHFLFVTIMLASVGYASFSFVQAASKRQLRELPTTMEEVDWHSSESSEYCLACHKPVGPAMAGLDLKHSHPQNVFLNENQLQAIADMGTMAGDNGTLICISCHRLGRERQVPYMLADTLVGGQFCGRCHPGHYARQTPHDLRDSSPTEVNRLGQTANEGGPCSACHLAHRYAREFVSCEHDPDGRCVTCHQARRCAHLHAREHMEHPESRCLECHDPHDMSQGEFLKHKVVELCILCHDDFAEGVEEGMHPLDKMDYPVPQELIDAGAWIQSDRHELTCAICHVMHEAQYGTLLTKEVDSNQLCLTCHADKLADEKHENLLFAHARSPQLNEQQQEVVEDWETRLGPDGELLCLSCHRVHEADASVALLMFQPQYGETCVACHPAQGGLVGTVHDLRTNFPDEKNIADMTPVKHGPCSACHLAHRSARGPVSQPGDPAGRCGTCHQPDRCAQARMVTGQDHPETPCTRCHNPHERRYGHFLAKPEAELCTECHAAQAGLVGGPHDHSQNSAAWPDGVGGLCLSCHVPHGGERADLFRMRGTDPVGNHDDVCLVCHAETAWDASTAIAAIHPHEISPEQNKVELALVPRDEEGNMRMGCRTCHDPHGGPEPVHLARVGPDQPTESLCFHCHAEKQYIKYTGHSAECLLKMGFDVDSCKPCHAMHANRDGTWGQMLSPRFMMESCQIAPESGVGGCVPCLACHHANGPAPVRTVATHPEKEMFNAISPDAPGYLPLFDAAGQVDPMGHVVCRTCHLSHGRLDLLRRVAERESLSHAEQSAIRTQLRSFIPPNICTECHGHEARFRYLFFHNPERRVFPRPDSLEQPQSPPSPAEDGTPPPP